MEHPLDTWPTKQELAQKLGVNERTIERKIDLGELRSTKRPVPGRRPLIVIHPEDATALEQKTLKPIPVSPSEAGSVPDKADTSKSTPPVLSSRREAKTPEVMESIERLLPTLLSPVTDRLKDIAKATRRLSISTALPHQVYFTREEATVFLGLSATYVDRARKDGTLSAVRVPGVRGWRFHREVLRQHKVSISTDSDTGSVSEMKAMNGAAHVETLTLS